MKIYFEDGELRKDINKEIEEEHIIGLNAKYGYSYCDNFLYNLMQTDCNAVIYTNLITAISNEYAWNKELKVPEIFIRNKDGTFTRVDKLTNRELREGHNIERMYIAGEFSER